MSDQIRDSVIMADTISQRTKSSGKAVSFKVKRRVRRKNRIKKQVGKSRSAQNALSLGSETQQKNLQKKSYPGPTKQTAARLLPDPLLIFRKRNILDDQQIWAFQRIRRAVQIITDASRIRISCFSDVPVQTDRNRGQYGISSESDFEIIIKHHYSGWIDRMTQARLAAGPVLDVIIDELSLSATDRKWGRRKGWAKDHLQRSLDLYCAFLTSDDRNG